MDNKRIFKDFEITYTNSIKEFCKFSNSSIYDLCYINHPNFIVLVTMYMFKKGVSYFISDGYLFITVNNNKPYLEFITNTLAIPLAGNNISVNILKIIMCTKISIVDLYLDILKIILETDEYIITDTKRKIERENINTTINTKNYDDDLPF
jgi:hypothetical protein